jgi:hypothetical protein
MRIVSFLAFTKSVDCWYGWMRGLFVWFQYLDVLFYWQFSCHFQDKDDDNTKLAYAYALNHFFVYINSHYILWVRIAHSPKELEGSGKSLNVGILHPLPVIIFWCLFSQIHGPGVFTEVRTTWNNLHGRMMSRDHSLCEWGRLFCCAKCETYY